MLRRLAPVHLFVIVIAVIAASLAVLPSMASAAPEVPRSSGNQNTGEGSSSEFGEAQAKAVETDKPVEVVSQREEDRRFFANPDGTVTQEISQTPMFAKDAEGDFKPIDPDLARDGARLEPKLTSTDVSFSATGDGPVSSVKTSSGDAVSMTLLDGELSAPKVDGGVATYERTPDTELPAATEDGPTPTPTGEPGGDDSNSEESAAEPVGESVRVSSTATGYATHVLLDAAPGEQPVYRFAISAGGLDVVLKDQRLVFTDGGTVVAETKPLRMWDADVDAAGAPEAPVDVDAKLVTTGGQTVLELRPSMDWLNDSEREYPVTIDPDPGVIDPQQPAGDTWVYETQPTNDGRGSDVNLRVGSNDGNRRFRSILYYRYKSLTALTIKDATLSMRQYANGASGCADKQIQARPMSGGDQYGATWSTRPGYDSSVRYLSTASFNAGNACSPARKSIDVTPMVNAWAGGQQSGAGANNRQAIVLLAPDELDTTQEKRFCSEDWNSSSNVCSSVDDIPKLKITYETEIGAQSWYSTTDHELNDRSSLSVNNRNGNAIIQATDATFTGVGQDLTVGRTYNSQNMDADTTLGLGWNMGFGPDVWIAKKSAYRYDYHGPNGTVMGSFLRKSSSTSSSDYKEFYPPINGIGTDLSATNNTATSGLTLKFRKSPLRYDFDEVTSSGNAYLTKIRDRSGNHIDFTYSGMAGNRPKLTKITDTVGREYTVTYSGARITQITEAADATASGVTRSWQYGYTGGQLTSFTDAQGQTWTYEYNSDGLVTGIVGPGSTGTRTETQLTYNTSSQVTKTSYRYGSGTNDFYDYTFAYNASATPAACKEEDKAKFGTEVTDPRANTTTYCFAGRDNLGSLYLSWAYDGEGNKRGEKYNADNQPTFSSSGTGAETATEYSGAGANDPLGDRVKKVTQPKNDGAGEGDRLTSGMEYAADTGENAYLPSNSRDSSNDCNRYTYDSKGRTTDTYSGFTANSSGSCAGGGTPDSAFHRRYDDATGNVTSSWDDNAGSSPSDADKTIYTYWAVGDSGYVANTKDMLKSVRKPGGDCSTGSTRKLCTSYTYDKAGRTKTKTDGRGKVTSYRYDKNDRVTGVYYDGVTEAGCNLAFGAGCLTYGYDLEGNMISRVNGVSQQTNFGYDRLNRRTSVETPFNGLGHDTVAYTYDGVGNLTSYTDSVAEADSPHPVTYTYNDANQLASITESSETITVKTDENGRTTEMEFPKTSGAGARVEYDWAKNGRPKELRLENHAGTQKSKITYNYKSGTKDTARMQSRTVTGAPTGMGDQNGTWTYGYSKQRLTSANDSNGSNHSYVYDKIGNLTKETIGSTSTYFGYDMVGRLCWKGPNNSSGSVPQSCSSTAPSGASTYAQDAAGNSLGIGSGAESYQVNERNQVNQIDGDAMTYLDQGNDLRRDHGSTREINSSLGVTATKTGGTTAYIVRDPNGDVVTYRDSTGKRFNYVTEPNGNVVWLTDGSGAQVGGYEYAPYGKAAVFGTEGAGNKFRWLGEQQNPDTSSRDGHYKFGARYYDLQGHFTQPDPLSGGMSDPRTMTGYNYAAGDPINQADASGMYYTGSLCDTNTGYWSPPGCYSPYGGAEPPLGGYHWSTEQVVSPCVDAGISAGFTAGGTLLSKSAIKNQFAYAVVVLGGAFYAGKGVINGCF